MPLVCFEDDTKLVRTTKLFWKICCIAHEYFLKKPLLLMPALNFGFCLQACNMKKLSAIVNYVITRIYMTFLILEY